MERSVPTTYVIWPWFPRRRRRGRCALSCVCRNCRLAQSAASRQKTMDRNGIFLTALGKDVEFQPTANRFAQVASRGRVTGVQGATRRAAAYTTQRNASRFRPCGWPGIMPRCTNSHIIRAESFSCSASCPESRSGLGVGDGGMRQAQSE